MLENIRLSFQGIWSHKMRSILTMLGIIIGIASIIAIVSTIQGTNEQIKQNLVGSNTNAVEIQLCKGEYSVELEYEQIPDGIPVIDESVRQKIEDLDTVEDVSLYRKRSWSSNVYHLGTAFQGSVKGVDIHYMNVNSYQVYLGRGFTQADFDNFHKVAILDATAAQTLFSGNPVGQTIEIGGEPYTVIGLITPRSTYEPVIKSMNDYWMYANTSSGNVYIPDVMWGDVYKYDEPQNVVLKAASTDEMTKAGKSAADILTANLSVGEGSDYSYRSQDAQEQAKQLQQLASSTNRQLIWIASISLLVGGIGVMNIMLVSVTERTREIGLKKAIGAKKSRIRWQFLTEAAVLTSLGGLIGVLAGIAMSVVISRLTGAPTAISIPAILIAVVFSMVIGLVFGLVPAVKASNLNPIDALRRE